ncbi:DNRLRE domain-containing protein [Anaerostipes sp.]|uniref:DNRLRE domain-containing protein n=1 Tax=Anaerostipes sp. TaxID=1872530 RepID=UPI0025C50FEF|nr:DNRLRE domain-containing protein [Anaerostipes sp.]MBS7006937.1 DNRLRE domain-containing protein [Anaerostipes sp.]
MIKKAGKPALSAVLSFLLIFTSVPWNNIIIGSRQIKAAETKTAQPKEVKEVIKSESTKNSTTFRLSGGKKESVFYGQDIRYKDENGNLKDYDPSLVKIQDKTSEHGHSLKDYQYENKDGDKKQYLPKKLTESTPVLMEHDQYEISFAPMLGEDSLKEEKKAEDESNAFSSIKNLKRTKLQKEEVLTAEDEKEELPVSVAYESEDKSCSFLYQSLDTGIKESVTLKEIPESNELKFKFYAKNLTAKKNIGDGGITFYDKDSEDIIASLEAPSMNDATEEAYSEKLSYDIEPIKGEKDTYELTLRLDEAYLKDKDRKYPITIDPTVTWKGSADFWDVYVINGSYKNTNFYDSGVTAMMAGKASKGTYRTYLRFKDFTAKIKNKYVDSATLTMYETGDSTSGQTIEARRVTANWSRPGLTWSNRPGYSTNYGSVKTTGTTHKSRSINLTKYARECANGSITSYGVMLKNADETKKYGQFYSSRYSNASYRPKMSVTYYDGPTTPTSVSVTPQYMKKGQTLTAKWAGISSKSLNRVEYRVATYDPSKNAEVNANYRAYSGSTKLGTAASGSASVADSKNWPEGCYKFVIRGVDNGGIKGTGKGYIFYVDGTAPKINSMTIDAGDGKGGSEENPSSNMTPALKWNITEKYLSKVEYKVGNGSYVNAGSALNGQVSIPASNFKDAGTYQISMKVTDKAGYTAETSRTYYYIDNSQAADYKPANAKISSSYGKNIVSWDKKASLPGSIYYEVYRGESSDFTPDASNLVIAAVKDSYCADTRVGDGKDYYYKVRSVKLSKKGNVIGTSDYVNAGHGKQDAKSEYQQWLGCKDYRETMEFGTPNGNGTVDKAGGNLTYQTEDFTIPAGQLSMGLSRTYNSQSDKGGMLGNGWYDSFHKEIYQVGENLIFQDSDGTYVTFEKQGDSYVSKESKDYKLSFDEETPKTRSSYSSDSNPAVKQYVEQTAGNVVGVFGKGPSKKVSFEASHNVSSDTSGGQTEQKTVTKNISYACTITTKDNTIYQFNSNGQLTAVKEPNDNFILYEYDSKGRLKTVTSDKIKTLTMKYYDGEGEKADLLKEIVLPDGTKMEYTYSGSNLTKAVHSSSDGSESVSYEYGYDEKGFLNDIKDARGNSYEITYDSNRAVKVKKPNGEYQKLVYVDGKTTVSFHKSGDEKISEDSITYDKTNGKVLTSVNAAGNKTSYQYEDTSNDLLCTGTTAKVYYQTVTDSGKVNFTSKEVTTKTQYDANENVTMEKDETGQVTQTTYGTGAEANLPKTEVTKQGDKTVSNVSYSYDKSGNTIKETDSVAETETICEYDEDGDVTLEENYEEGELTSKEETDYNETDHIITEDSTVTQGNVQEASTTVLDAMGREIKSQDENTTETTSTTYDFLGRQIKVQKQLGDVTKTEEKKYDANGTLLSEVSDTGVTTSYSYDVLNRVKEATEVSKDGITKTTKTDYGYADQEIHTLSGMKSYQNLTVVTTTVNGKVQSEAYTDASGNTVREKSSGIYTDHVYTEDGKETATIVLGTKSGADVKGKITLNLYDSNGKQTHTVQNPVISDDGAAIDPDTSIVNQTAYDDKGNETAKTDGNGNTISYTYDDQNRVTKVSQGDNSTSISYTMGADGVNTTSITDAMGHENIEVTNAAGLTETTTSKGNLGESISTKFTYDTNGNKTKETYENGAYKTYHYDKKNRLTETNTYEAPEAGSETGSRSLKTAYRYDGNDQLIEMVDYQVSGNTETAYRYTECEYDGLQRKTAYAELSQAEKPTADEIRSHAVKYTYDAEGKLTKVTYPTKKDGVRSLSYHYTSDGWLSVIKADVYKESNVKEATVRAYTYDHYGKITEIKDYRNLLSDGDKAVKKTYNYDSFDRVAKMVYTDLEHPEIVMESYAYSYDKNSNIVEKIQINNYPEKDEEKVNETKHYTYDALGRLVKTVTTDHRKDDSKQTVSYTYDKVGNRLVEDKGDTKTTYDYNGLDQVTTSTIWKDGTAQENRQYAYDKNGNEIGQTNGKTGEILYRSYDAENRLTEVSVNKDGKNAVIQQNRYNGDGQRIQRVEGDQTTNYYYQDGMVSYTTDAEGEQISQDLLGTDGNIIGTQRYSGDHTAYYVYNKDVQGSTTNLLKADGTADVSYRYEDFGETTRVGENTSENETCYTGGRYDEVTGLYYLNARYYNPEDGRFLSEDTYRGEVNEPDTNHLYVYCANNPINYVDPSGHGPVGIIVGGLIGFGVGKLILPKIADRMHLKGKKRKWFIRLGTGITTILGGAVGNYVGGAITSLYASGGKAAVIINRGVAKTFAKYARASLSQAKSGKGWVLKFRKYTMRVMSSGGGRKNYMRISHITRGAMNISGKYSNNRATTHIKITFTNLVKMIKLVKKIK